MKVVEILAPGFEEVEALSPVDYLRRAGAEVCTAGISGENGTFSEVIPGSHGIKVLCDVNFETYVSSLSELPDAVVIPGGLVGSKNIGKNKTVLDFICRMYESKKLVCAICAAPVIVLAQTGVLAGHHFACYPGMENDIAQFVPEEKNAHATEGSVYVKDKAVVRDGNLITGRGAGAAEEFAMEIVNALCGEAVMQKVKNQTCQR